ncbi:MAG: hypothetical protein A2622_04505 [Bdellovibrionales bacterium RIFCSPHIGHO2_01_FULL_40_29]|nr:MAG: hypothetical protein A2622_04505 [Bdellovibrionales bacterium RIFCSPHIGHO2_01_FULL_40_29]OFZ34804.1 MAG: hypothetical protein A3D17_10870 [Bdellovibrionales bacterium RIFCSPHIGHO2_02_FULL_40_15]
MSKIFFLFTFIFFNLVTAFGQSLEKKINLTLDKKAQIDLELSKTDENVKKLELLLREKRKILLQRARALSYLKSFKWGGLLSLDDPSKFDLNLKILAKLNQYDFNLFKDYKSAIRNLAQGRIDLEKYTAELQAILTDLKKQEQLLAADEERRKKEFTRANKKSLLTYKGKMPIPTEGQVKLSFGSHRDQENEYAFLVRGLLIETKPEANIVSVGPGKVIFRDAIPYWGETLIIQHDDNYYSIYAGLQMNKNLSDSVQINDIIAVTKGKEFYFELRHFDNPINPKGWLKEVL